MVTVERGTIVQRPPGEVLRYLADVGHTTEGDPATTGCLCLYSGPVAAGSRWVSTSRFRGRTTRLDDRLVRYEPDHLVFVGENRMVTATDDIRLRPWSKGRTAVVYQARLQFRGLARFADPFLTGAFEKLAAQIAEQLPRALGSQ